MFNVVNADERIIIQVSRNFDSDLDNICIIQNVKDVYLTIEISFVLFNIFDFFFFKYNFYKTFYFLHNY